MDRTESIRQAMYEACKARDVMWEVVLKELEFRNAPAAREARAAGRGMRVRPLVGFSTRAAALAWSHLDYRARADWIWICQSAHEIWVRGVMELAPIEVTPIELTTIEPTVTETAPIELTPMELDPLEFPPIEPANAEFTEARPSIYGQGGANTMRRRGRVARGMGECGRR
ncbi:MAG TPA: hypothetical protein VFQ25_14685 [Ktedonobacterales bacterium]|nr:hypothetical protein [Ktedonobacterales bacterium]